MAVTLVLVGAILKAVKPKMTPQEKNARIRIAGQLRRVCGQHQDYLIPGAMAVVDDENCDYCKIVEQMGGTRE